MSPTETGMGGDVNLRRDGAEIKPRGFYWQSLCFLH